MASFWTGTVADVRGSWVRSASVRGLFAVPLLVAIVLGVTSVGAARVLAQGVPSAAAGPPGTGLAWGTNSAGRLGDGTTTDSSSPVSVNVPAGTTITAVAGGAGHSLAVTSAGTALAWGDNAFGQLGDGTTIPSSSTPVAVDVPAGTTVTALSGGGVHNLAVTSAGTALAWGDNFWGQLGDGSTTRSRTPVAVNVPAGTTITAVAAGQGHSLAVTSAGTALAWGDNSSGQLGDGTATDSSIPVAADVPAGTTITAVAAGGLHSLALTSGGDVLAWGANGSGQLGDGTTTSSSTPVAVDVPAGTTVTAVAAGGRHSLAVTSAGDVLAWGDNTAGQLGDGSTTHSSTPVAVNVPAGTTITAVATGSGHSLAVTSTDTALAWGDNTFGQLGDGSTTSSIIPVAVDLPAGTTVTAIAGGSFHSLAIVPSTSTTTLQVSPPNPTPNQDVTLTATVTCTTDTPTGTITFRTTTTDLATVPLDSNNTATHTTRLPPGTHTLTAHHTSTNTCPSNQSESTTITITAPDDPDAPNTPNDPDAPDDPDDPDLPITGPNLLITIGTATLLILTGAALVHLTRRHRPTHHPN